MSKRIAIQLFGYLRTHDETIKSFFKNIVIANKQTGFDVDIFIHTWNYCDSDNLKGTDYNEIVAKYNPKSIKIESQKDVFKNKEINVVIKNKKRKVSDIYNLFHSINSVNKLRKEYETKNGLKYDWVVQTRFDILFSSSFCINDFISSYTQNNLKPNPKSIFYAMALFGIAKIDDELFLSHSDLLYFANSSAMDKATLLLKNFNSAIRKKYISTEWFILNHWKNSGLKPVGIDFRYDKDFLIVR